MPARPEITGRKCVASDAAGQRGDADDDVDAYSIKQFCRRHGISEGFYFKLKKLGLGPREMEAGARVLISKEAAADWRREREGAAAED